MGGRRLAEEKGTSSLSFSFSLRYPKHQNTDGSLGGGLENSTDFSRAYEILNYWTPGPSKRSSCLIGLTMPGNSPRGSSILILRPQGRLSAPPAESALGLKIEHARELSPEHLQSWILNPGPTRQMKCLIGRGLGLKILLGEFPGIFNIQSSIQGPIKQQVERLIGPVFEG